MGLSQEAFAALVGSSKPSQVRYESGDRAPDSDYLLAALDAGVDVAYLLTGSRTTSMVSAYFNRPLLQIVGDANFTDPQPTVEFLQVPVFDAALAAGAGAHNHAEAIEGAVAFRKDWLRSIGVAPTSAVIARARGDSMQPTIQDGDMLLIDRGRDVANLFRILQRHYPQFLETLRFQLTTRVEFERLVAIDPDTLTDLERAARFLYLQRTAFGGKVSGRNFGVSPGRPGRFNLTTLEPMLEDLHGRLAGVVIECLDWRDFLRRYDTPETLFYLDPPYWGCEGDYGRNLFDRAAFADMAEQLQRITGRFILSINDVPEIRQLFAWARIEAVATTYTVGNHAGRGVDRAELLISNGPG